MDAVGAAGPMATTRGVSLRMAAFEEAPIDGDADLLRQLVMILLDNAIKFTSAGGNVEVSVERRGGGATLTIADNGWGIAPDQMPHIFERFYRGDTARGRRVEAAGASGAGLGLSIAQWIAHAHHAKLSVESTVDRGTAVSLQIAAVSTS